jgi:hypothetical protein
VTGDVDKAYLDRIEKHRSDAAKAERAKEAAVLEIHNAT